MDPTRVHGVVGLRMDTGRVFQEYTIYGTDIFQARVLYTTVFSDIVESGVALMCSQRKNGKSIIYLCSQFFNVVQSIF